MTAPSQEQIDQFIERHSESTHEEAGCRRPLHCRAGADRHHDRLLVVEQGLSARDAIARVRRLRPGSIETEEQEEAIVEFARRKKMAAESDVP